MEILQLSFVNLCNIQQLINFTITEITIDCQRKLTLEEFKFLFHVRPKLKKLQLKQLSNNIDNSEILSEFLERGNKLIDSKIMSRCNLFLNLQIDKGSKTNTLFQQLVFGQAFQWSDVTINDESIFEFIEKIPNEGCFISMKLLKCLIKLKIQIKSEFLRDKFFFKTIGNQLIYDERSILEKLCFDLDEVNIHELQSLMQNAQAFRDKIERSKQQQYTCLSLKKFIICIQKDLHQDVEGCLEDKEANLIYGDIIFFEYITIERIKLFVTKSKGTTSISQCKHAQAWLQFQKSYKRKNLYFSVKKIDWSGNNQVKSQKAWSIFCETFLFSDNAPILKHLNLYNMNIQDEQVNYICEKANAFFQMQPKNYVSPLKIINFSENTFISANGWNKIGKCFFFSEHVNLEKLNINGIERFDKEKSKGIYSSAESKAEIQNTKKLNLHTLDCQDSSLRYQFAKIMNLCADTKHNPYELYMNNPNSFGQVTSLINIALYKSNLVQFRKGNDREKGKNNNEKMFMFSEYHIQIADGFLRPLNKYFYKNNHQLGHFPIDIATCEELCTIFKYRESVGDPYPYQLLFTSDACQFYSHASCKIRILNFIVTDTQNSEKVNQFQVLELWQQIKSPKTSLDMVFMDYQFNDDLVDQMIQNGYTERDVVNLIRLFPPSSLILRVSLSLQALKGIYSIMYDNHQLNYAQILYDKDTSLNVGIGFSLRESVYKTNPISSTFRCFKSIMYHFFDLFVTPVSKYSSTKEIRKLNLYLSNQGNYLVMLTLLTIIYFLICLFSPYAWQHYYTSNDSNGDSNYEVVCSKGITDVALYFYLVIAIFFFLAETFLYQRISLIIPNHIEGLIQEKKVYQAKTLKDNQSPQKEELIFLMDSPENKNKEGNFLISENTKSIIVKKVTRLQTLKTNMISKFEGFAYSQNGRMLGYIVDLSLSQIAKLSLFTDVSFIMLTFYCKYRIIALLALISTGFNISLQLYELLMFIVTHCFIQHKDKAKLLSTKYINDFYEISVLGRNIALSTILDIVAPYNVTIIPNNSLTKALFPSYAGKSMSNSVRSYIVKFLFGDLPHIILQSYFVIYVAYHPPKYQGVTQPVVINPLLYVTILNTIKGIVFSFMKFSILRIIRLMSIRPSSISQEDFDDLIEKKQEEFMDGQISFIKQEQKIFEALTYDIDQYP